MKKIQKHTQGDMFAHIEACKKSNQSQRMYCKQHGLTYSTFLYWAKRYRKLNTTDKTKAEFIPVTLEPIPEQSKQSSIGQLHFHYPNGVQLLCSESISPVVLKTLINP